NSLDSADSGSQEVAVVTATPDSTSVDVGSTPEGERVSHTISSEVADLYEQVRPSIVRINALAGNSNSGGVGSGIVLDKEGHILTNNHVIENFSEIDAVFADGTAATAVVVGRDPGNDLAVLKVEVPEEIL